MLKIYSNNLQSERSVEVVFITEQVETFEKTDRILDFGGIPTEPRYNQPIYDELKKVGCQYEITDFRGGQWQGSFMEIDFGDVKFDRVIALSALEHTPFCTESPNPVLKLDEDKAVFQKLLDLLKPGGAFYLTVPFGKPKWWNYHHSYDFERILYISDGAKVEECFIYTLQNENWVLTKMEDTLNISNPGPINGVGLFKFIK
jgi:SAM-dependent methyltransferase